ncbi:MAG TPA: hypothetical protein VIJ62_13065 [Rhizomicrobium sp.]
MADTDNSSVIRFPINRAVAGGVHCPPLNIHFPQLYRIVQKVTAADLIAAGMVDEAPIAEFIHYAIGDDESYMGSVVSEPVQGICDEDMASVVIRHHRSFEEASAYLDAVMDVCGAEFADSICRTGEGYFTMARRATEESWPGPTVFYVAVHEADNLAGFDDRQIATAPDGTTAQSDYL